MDTTLALAPGQVIGGLVGGLFQQSAQRAANKTNLAIARATNEANERINAANIAWQEKALRSQQEYASFENQRKMAEEAGINPYAALGNAALGGQAGTPVSHGMQSASVAPEDAFGRALGSGISDAANVVSLLASAEKAKEEAKGEQINNLTRGAQNVALLNMSGLQQDALRLQNELSEKQNPLLVRASELANQKLATEIALQDIEKDIRAYTRDRIQPAQLDEILQHVNLMMEQGLTEQSQRLFNDMLGRAHITSANAQMLQAKVAQMVAPSQIAYNRSAAANQMSLSKLNDVATRLKKTEAKVYEDFGWLMANEEYQQLITNTSITHEQLELMYKQNRALQQKMDWKTFEEITGAIIPIGVAGSIMQRFGTNLPKIGFR